MKNVFHDSFLSRLTEKPFDELPPGLVRYIVMRNNGQDYSVPLTTRGISIEDFDKGKFKFLEQRDGHWYFKGEKDKPKGDLLEYEFFDRSNAIAKDSSFESKVFQDFIPHIRDLATGKVQGTNRFDTIEIITPSARDLSASYRNYLVNREQYSLEGAQQLFIQEIINNMLKGSLKDRPSNGDLENTVGKLFRESADQMIFGKDSAARTH